MNGYFSASHFVQNENIFYLEIIAKKQTPKQPKPWFFSFPFEVQYIYEVSTFWKTW